MSVHGERRLRVAFLNQSGNDAGGAERTLATFLRHRPADFVAHAIVLSDGAYANELRDLGISVHVVPAPPGFVEVRRESIAPANTLAALPIALCIARLLEREAIDVLFTNSMKAHLLGALAGRLARTRCVMHFHDIIDGPWLRVIRIAARLGSDERIACSQLVADWFDVARTTPIYGPVELADYDDLPSRERARAALGIAADVPVVALIGRINRWKGHDRFLRIAALVNRRRKTQFLVVGSPIFRDDEFLPELEAMVDELGLRDVVSFVPWVDDLRTVYGAIDVNVNCSTREPLGRSPAEAAAAGVPSVVFADGGAAETITDRAVGRVVAAFDEEAFAEAVLDLLADGSTEASRTHIKASARRFDATVIAGQMAGVIRQASRGGVAIASK